MPKGLKVIYMISQHPKQGKYTPIRGTKHLKYELRDRIYDLTTPYNSVTSKPYKLYTTG